MFDNAAKNLWRPDGMRRNAIGSSAEKRRAFNEAPEREAGGAKPSESTHQAIDAFFAAHEVGDKSELARTLNEVIQSWRADNAAGGVPIHEHLPLPSRIATPLSNELDASSDQEKGMLLHALLAKADSGARLAVRGQLEADRSVQSEGLQKSSSFAQMSDRSQGKFGPPWAEEEGEWGADGSQNIPQSNGSPAYRVNPRFKPPAPPSPVPLNGYRPGEWARNGDPRTSKGTKLVPFGALNQQQQNNLRQRNWIHPTGKQLGREKLIRGWGFFGSEREEKGGVYFHGGYDAPGKEVLLPTKAKFVGYDADTRIATFDLGDGLTLQLVHIDPSPQLQRLKVGMTVDAGVHIGTVESRQDHVHIQIRAVGPGSDKWVVDPTPFLERRARTFWRSPMLDPVEDIIDIFAADAI